MASVYKYYHLKGTPRPTDLCPQCFNPSLKTLTYLKIGMDGVTTLGTRDYCPDCKVWTTKLRSPE